MLNITYISIKKFAQKVVFAFREHLLEVVPTEQQGTESLQADTPEKVKVSLNDLKIISSALLHFKKVLLKKNDTARAQAVSEVDERIYHLILAIEQAREMESKEVMAA